MARLPRLVLPGIPHHITQRGNRRERTFFEDGDYALYVDLLAQAAGQARMAIWAYCLMPNHVHIIAVPEDVHGLRRTFRFVHRHYTGYINARLRTTGHLWQGRFSSVAMDEEHLHHAFRYIASIRSGRGWWSGRKTGAGPAPRRIWQERTIMSSRSRLHSNGSVILRRFWANPSMKR